jgi:hypothetical protein
MIKRNHFFLILIVTSLFCTCKKDQELIDTYFPGDYLPAYPGSYWIYSNQDTIKTENSYRKDTLETPVYYQDNIYAIEYCEFFECGYYPIYDHQTLRNYTLFPNYCTESIKLLDETLNKSWMTYNWKDYFIRREVTAKDVQISLPNSKMYDSVIVVEENIETIADYGKKEHYYAKNVGLIGIKTIHMNFDTLNTFDYYLIEYKINK